MQEAITINVGFPPMLPQFDYITVFSTAVKQRRRFQLWYPSWGGADSERDFDPYGIVFNVGYWYTAGYCHLRQDYRTFRLDRITALEPLEWPFERPEDFDALAYVLDSLAFSPEGEQVEVLLETALERALEFFPAFMGKLEPVEKGVVFR